jgi:hypothetical protein
VGKRGVKKEDHSQIHDETNLLLFRSRINKVSTTDVCAEEKKREERKERERERKKEDERRSGVVIERKKRSENQ